MSIFEVNKVNAKENYIRAKTKIRGTCIRFRWENTTMIACENVLSSQLTSAAEYNVFVWQN